MKEHINGGLYGAITFNMVQIKPFVWHPWKFSLGSPRPRSPYDGTSLLHA